MILRIFIVLTLFIAFPAYADTVVKKGGVTYIYKGEKPPIVIRTENGNKYIINSDSEKLREVILRADKLRIKHKKSGDDDWRRDWHKELRDETAYESGYHTGKIISD